MMESSSVRGFPACLMLAIVCQISAGCSVIGNRFEKQIPVETIALPSNVENLPAAGNTLAVTTWNIGYGGMGEESDFIFDGGTQRRPPSAKLVDKNVAGIVSHLSSVSSDVLLLQEVAKPSWINHGRNVFEAVQDALPDTYVEFNADILTRGIPRPFRVELGNAIVSRKAADSFELAGLPLEPYFEFGLFRKNYRVHVIRLAGQGKWTVMNIHLSAFDPEDIDVRRQQVAKLFNIAQAEFLRGRRVVVGGDWNLLLSEAELPHTTDPEHSFWVRSFPDDLRPAGWTIVADLEVPTVRLAHKPYVAGENRTIAIDGFAVSPNVEVLSVSASQLGFRSADHNPVTGTFRVR